MGGDVDGTYRVLRPTFWSQLPLLGTFFSPDALIATTTRFTVVEQTGLDIAVMNGAQSVVEYILTGTTTTPVLDCNPSGFSLTACLVSLIVPPSNVLESDFTQIRDGFLSRVPFGYVTRFMEIALGEASSTLPTLSYTFPDDFPAEQMAGVDLTFNPWGEFYTDGSLVKDELVSSGDDPKNIWEIMQPLINIIVYLALAMLIIKDLTAIHPNHRQNL